MSDDIRPSEALSLAPGAAIFEGDLEKEKEKEAEENETEKVALLQAAFSAFDKCMPGKSNTITLPKLKFMLEQHLGELPTETEVNDMINGTDTSGDGEVSFAEFLTMLQHTKEQEDKEEDLYNRVIDVATIKEVFDVFDADGDGFITLEELKAVMNDNVETLSDAQLQGMVELADPDNENGISYKAFKVLMMKN